MNSELSHTLVAHGSRVAETFQELAALVYAVDDLDQVYAGLCEAAPRLVSGCDHASIMLSRSGSYFTASSSDHVAAAVDALERDEGEGPCVDAIEDKTAYIEPDLSNSTRWPRLARRVLAETPVRGAAGFRLIVDDVKAGALNLFSDTVGGFTSTSVNEATLLASFTSLAVSAANERQTVAHLREGLISNREIGMAIGLMMAFHKVNSEQAFEILRKTSQDMNIKLVEVARDVVRHENAR